ncbi:MAG: cupin domain-containing protein [Burkholderiales bacterium]|nr:cupin domain-containing protein [Burkholderiales bacterium]MDE1925832.1 cupin domain-containing protein [Burkholderiales bacterium]
MHVVRFDRAPAYAADGHFGMVMHYLQGRDAGYTEHVWVGHSVVAPEGGTTAKASPFEKVYVVLAGELEITGGAGDRRTTVTLGPLDSCRIEPGEERQLLNRGSVPASLLLIMATKPAPG